MKTKKEMFNQLARVLTHKMIRADSEGWPPDSALGFYQPLRPQMQESSITKDTTSRYQSYKHKDE